MELPRLSCEQCRRRKTKCDKDSPCSACVKAGLVCNSVSRNRKSRGSTKRMHPSGTSLDARIAHLEDLVLQLRTHSKQTRPENVDPSLEAENSHKRPSSNKIGNFVAPSFWEALSHEVTGIRDILEDGDDNNEGTSPDVPSGSDQGQSEMASQTTTRTLLFNHIPPIPDTAAQPQQQLTSDMTFMLLTIYQQRVDCIFKVLDWPRVAEMVRKNQIQSQDPSKRQGTPSEYALEASIYFTALATLSDEECKNMLVCTKDSLLMKLRTSAETAIAKAGLLQTPDLIVLQAFVIYLSGLRASSQCASSWHLVAIAVRIAVSMRLGSDDKTNYSSYDIQIRRRLWFSIGVLDCQFAMDRGSLPLLYISDFQSPPPLNIDDHELHSATASSQEFTSMSFSSMTHQAILCQKKIYEKPTESQGQWGNWEEKLQALTDFEHFSQQRFSKINEKSSALERYAKTVAVGALANMKVMLRRPPYRSEHNSVPPWDDFDVMKATTEVLEMSLRKQVVDDFSPFFWYYWVKWYALAVLLAELCRPGDGPEVERSLSVAQMSFQKYAHLISDSEAGMLWKPIARLMHRVQRLRCNETSSSKLQAPYRSDATGGDLGLGALQIPDRSLEPLLYDPSIIMQPNPLQVGNWNAFNTPPQTQFNGFGNGWDAGGNNSVVAFDDEMCWMHWDNFMRDMNAR